MGARETALNALIACRKDGAWSNGILKEYTAIDGLDKREAALAARRQGAGLTAFSRNIPSGIGWIAGRRRWQRGCVTVYCKTGASWIST